MQHGPPSLHRDTDLPDHWTHSGRLHPQQAMLLPVPLYILSPAEFPLQPSAAHTAEPDNALTTHPHWLMAHVSMELVWIISSPLGVGLSVPKIEGSLW